MVIGSAQKLLLKTEKKQKGNEDQEELVELLNKKKSCCQMTGCTTARKDLVTKNSNRQIKQQLPNLNLTRSQCHGN